MAERTLVKKTPSVVPQTKKRPSSSSKAQKSKRDQIKPETKSASSLTKKQKDDIYAKEEQYKLMNAELEAKTAELVKQAEQLMREQNDVLSKPLSTLLLTDDHHEDSRIMKQEPALQLENREKVTSPSEHTRMRIQRKESKTQSTKVSRAAVEDSADLFVAKTIRSIEEKMNDAVAYDDVLEDDDICNAGDNVASGISDAQIRVFKAKIRILQEELDQLSCEYYKKDDENAQLRAKMKELEEDRARLQKTTDIQRTQIEKHRVLAEESAKKSEALQLQVSALNKEIENLNRAGKQAASAHSTMEVRLNRALEEVERSKTELSKMKQLNKDKMKEEHQSKENVLAENRMLKKQKAELIVGFKKQLKLIDLLKRQKMHFEAAKLLSFTEEEFMKALDWGNS